MADPVRKYDSIAPGYSSRYADPSLIARRQFELLTVWGSRINAGGRVLELGCADGFVTEFLARMGLRVTAIDFSPAMIDVARSRLSSQGLEAEFVVADINTFEPDATYDAVLGLMWTFFAYAKDPALVLSRLHAKTPKLLIDVNPRDQDSRECEILMRKVGFHSVAVRPFFVPQSYRLGPVLRGCLSAAERTPKVRDLILRWKFVQILKGER